MWWSDEWIAELSENDDWDESLAKWQEISYKNVYNMQLHLADKGKNYAFNRFSAMRFYFFSLRTLDKIKYMKYNPQCFMDKNSMRS